MPRVVKGLARELRRFDLTQPAALPRMRMASIATMPAAPPQSALVQMFFIAAFTPGLSMPAVVAVMTR